MWQFFNRCVSLLSIILCLISFRLFVSLFGYLDKRTVHLYRIVFLVFLFYSQFGYLVFIYGILYSFFSIHIIPALSSISNVLQVCESYVPCFVISFFSVIGISCNVTSFSLYDFSDFVLGVRYQINCTKALLYSEGWACFFFLRIWNLKRTTHNENSTCAKSIIRRMGKTLKGVLMIGIWLYFLRISFRSRLSVFVYFCQLVRVGGFVNNWEENVLYCCIIQHQLYHFRCPFFTVVARLLLL